MTNEEIELRDKIAIEAMKKIMGYEAVAEYLQRGDEAYTIGTKAVATSAYTIANEMMRARKEMT